MLQGPPVRRAWRAATRRAGRTSSCQRFGVTSTASDRSRGRPAQPPALQRELQDHEEGVGRTTLLTYDGPDLPGARTRTTRASRTGRRPRRSPVPYGAPGEVDENGHGARALRRAEALHVTAPAALPGVRRQPRHAAVVRRGERHADDPHGRSPDPHAAHGDLPGGRGVGGPQPARSARASASCRTFYIYPNGTSPDAVDAQIAESVRKYEEPVWRGWYRAVRLHGGRAAARRGGPGPAAGRARSRSASTNERPAHRRHGRRRQAPGRVVPRESCRSTTSSGSSTGG